jgi:hypothetical protein
LPQCNVDDILDGEPISLAKIDFSGQSVLLEVLEEGIDGQGEAFLQMDALLLAICLA